MQKKRDYYEHERQHIILKIDGNDVRVNKSTKVRDIIDGKCPGKVLLNV